MAAGSSIIEASSNASSFNSEANSSTVVPYSAASSAMFSSATFGIFGRPLCEDISDEFSNKSSVVPMQKIENMIKSQHNPHFLSVS